MNHNTVRLAGAPALLVSSDDPHVAGERGTVLFYHGFTAQKEANIKELESLADAGWLAVGIDNAGHGARRFPDWDRRFKDDPRTVSRNFFEVVRTTVQEVPSIVDSLVGQGLADPDHLGIAGISMGGYITYGAVLLERRIRAATPILGSPQWGGSPGHTKDDSPHRRPEQFYPLALLSQTAGADEHVPPAHARDLHRTLERHYASAPARQRYVEYPGARHFMPEADWNRLWSNVLGWFGEYL